MSTTQVSTLDDPGDRDAPVGSLPWAKWLVGQIRLQHDECLRDRKALDRLLGKLDKHEAWRVLGYADREDVLPGLLSSGLVPKAPATTAAEAEQVLDALATAGVAVEAVDGRLRLSPASAVDEALRGRVAAHKAGILSLLATRPDAATVWRQAVETVAESLKLPPDVLEAARLARVRWVPAARLKDR